jgi:hypothetical protein
VIVAMLSAEIVRNVESCASCDESLSDLYDLNEDRRTSEKNVLHASGFAKLN